MADGKWLLDDGNNINRHLSSVFSRTSFVICPLPSALYHLPSALCHPLFSCEFRIRPAPRPSPLLLERGGRLADRGQAGAEVVHRVRLVLLVLQGQAIGVL